MCFILEPGLGALGAPQASVWLTGQNHIFRDFFSFSSFLVSWSQIFRGSGESLGIKNKKKTCFEVSQSSQNAQEMCRNDFRTSLEFSIFHDFQHFGTQYLRSGDFRESGPKNVSGTRFVSRIRPSWRPRPLTSTILGPLAMYWKCFQ